MGKYFHVDRARRTCIMYSVSKHGNEITKVCKITWFLRKKWIKKWREVVLRILQRFCGCFEKHSTGKHKENVRTVYNLFDHWNMVLSSDFHRLKTHLATRLVLHLFWRWQPVAGCWHAPFHCYVASLIVAGPYFLALLSGACHLLSRCVAQQLDSNNSVDLPRGPSVVAYICITAWIFDWLLNPSMYQRITILLHISGSIQVIFASRFIWRRYSNRATLLFHRKTWFVFLKNYVILCTLVILLPSFDMPQWNSSLCDEHENIIPLCGI